jgi:carboxymethylenebutenolidase
MSGSFAVMAAARDPRRVRCVASYYGTRLMTDAPESPHRALAGYPGEVYLAFAQHDDYVPLEIVARLRASLAVTPASHRIETYDGTHHGFAFPDRGTFDRAASERHYERLFALLRRNLAIPR